MIYLIGLGVKKEHITNYIEKLLENSDFIILEQYTSYFEDLSFLEKYKEKLIKADRKFFEEDLLNFIEENKDKNIAILIFGDVFVATTHQSLVNELKKRKITFKIINNVSIINLISNLGLSIYKFGKITSIPFLIRDKRIKIESPIKVIKDNQKIKAHSLILLDLDPIKKDYLKAEEALEYLLKNKIKEKIILCSRIAWNDEKIFYIEELNNET
ncbi:MAG TPA: diphthine synthase, partial [Nautiliaceae bacterium]|nr:diphthine synthase [Nautiliaceae bacterium]